jgi:hypothetical protein
MNNISSTNNTRKRKKEEVEENKNESKFPKVEGNKGEEEEEDTGGRNFTTGLSQSVHDLSFQGSGKKDEKRTLEAQIAKAKEKFDKWSLEVENTEPASEARKEAMKQQEIWQTELNRLTTQLNRK